MSTPAIFWPGSGSNPYGLAPMGMFDDEDAYVEDAPRVASWCAIRLGYPTMDVELSDIQFYTMFEQAISEYSAQVNEFNLRDNLLALQGSSTSGSITHRLIKGSPLPQVITLSEQYGTEAGVGGNVDWKKGYIDCSYAQQEYDLQTLWANVSESGNRIEIRRVFHERPPAIARGGYGFGDIAQTVTDGTAYMLGEFGWEGYDGGLNYGGTQFLLMPLYETALRIQAIELNDSIRRSQYSFELINNKIKIFPSPADGERIWFQYLVKNDRAGTVISNETNLVSDFSNAPYTTMKYTNINDVGKNWIRKYTLALAKESLGRILSKYESIPSPDAEIRMDGGILREEAEREKDTLWDQLRESLEEAGRSKQMEKMNQNEENSQNMLRRAPLLIYIG